MTDPGSRAALLGMVAACALTACGSDTRQSAQATQSVPSTAGVSSISTQAPSFDPTGRIVVAPPAGDIWSSRGPSGRRGRTEDWRDYAPGELLVKFRRGATFRDKAASLAAVGAVAAPAYRTIPGLHRVRLPAHVGVAPAVARLRQQSAVEYAEPNYLVREFVVPDDERFGEQWALHNTGAVCCGTADADIDAPEAWDVATGAADVVVAVIDTGVDFMHPDLAENMFRNEADCDADGADDDGNGYVDDCHGIDLVDDDGVPLDPRQHGTHVAGIIGARGNNGIGVSGVAWDVRMVACRFINSEGAGQIADAIECLDYAAGLRDRGINVVATNNSWGGGPPSRALDDAVRALRDRGILLVAAAGNSADSNDRFPQFPCNVDLANVLCVGASTGIDSQAIFTNLGRHTVHLFAPGESVLSTVPGASYNWFNGTSMAAPHVTGVVALLAAQDPAADWRARKNLILSTVDRLSPMPEYSVAGGRLNAMRALTCANDTLLAPLRPALTERIVRAIGTPLLLRAMHVRCGAPAGPVQVSVSGGGSVMLADDGTGDDEVAGDGVYAGRWTPQQAGEFEISFVGAAAAPFSVTVDPMVRGGFPATMLSAPERGWAWSGAGNHVLVGEVDGDAGQEIIVSGFSLGPLYAWNDDGTPVPGWPALDAFSTAYPVLGEFDGEPLALEIASESFYAGVRVYDHDAVLLPGWPQPARGVISPPAATDLDGDGVDEILTNPVRRSDGTSFGDFELPLYDQSRAPPTPVAVADLDGDGRVELVVATEAGIWASNVAGVLPGYPVHDPSLYLYSLQQSPIVGDVDADGAPEIIVFTDYIDIHHRSVIRIFSWDGKLERSLPMPLHDNASGAALADLDGDGVPEILFQSDWEIHAWRADGSELPGWPVMLNGDPSVNTIWQGSGALVVGDLNGDRCPEVVTMHGDFLVEELYPYNGKLRVFDCAGNELPGFPKAVPSMTFGMTPAISDLDGDGRNELVVATTPIEGERDALFVYELDRSGTHGPIEWGQYMGDARHSGYYPLGRNLESDAFLAVQRHGAGTVTTPGGTIDCGIDCVERYPKGASVTLHAAASPGATFERWDGACRGTASTCTVTVDELTRVSAWFSGPINVSVTGTGAGTVTSNPAGIQCPGDCSELFPPRTVVTLTAAAAAGSDLDRWSGACAGSAATCTVLADTAVSVVAHFVNSRTLTVSPTGSGQAVFSSTPAGIACGASCSAGFVPRSTVRLSYQPANDSYLSAWNMQGCPQPTPHCFISMTSDMTISPSVELKPLLTVNVAGQGQGTIRTDPAGIDCSATCSARFTPNSFVTIYGVPSLGSEVAEFSGACQNVNTTRCDFFMMQSSSVTVTFRSLPMVIVNVTGTGGGRVTSSPAGIDCGPTCNFQFAPGTTVSLTAAADSLSQFSGWSGACSGQAASCTVTVDQARTVGAAFTRNQTPGGGGNRGGGGGLPLSALVGLMILIALQRNRSRPGHPH